MSSLGINLRVDSSEVKQAKRDLDFLNKAALEAEKLDITLGGEELAKDTEMLRRAGLELTRLGSLVRTGDNKGGFLNVKQFQETSKLTKSIGTNLGSWTAHTQKLRNELKQVSADLKQLQRDSLSPGLSASARSMMLDDMEVLSGRREELRKELAGRGKYDARAGHLGKRAQEYSEALGGFGLAAEGAGMKSLKKMLGYGLAAVGGLSIIGLLKETQEKFKQQSKDESGLTVRGVQYYRRLSEWNYTPQEEAEYAMGLRRTTGAADMGTLSRLERFARLSNMDAGTAMGFIGTHYQVTAADVVKQRQVMDAMLVMGKRAKDGRSEALLQIINTNLQTAFHAQGNRALSGAQVSQVMAQTSALYNVPGTQGMSSNLFQTMQTALMPGGGPASEILKWDIIGGFGKGLYTPERMIELQTRRNRGLNDPENLRRALAGARRYSKTRAGQIMYMQMVLDSFGMQGGVDTATAIIDNGDRILAAKMPGSGAIAGEIDQLDVLYKGTVGYGVARRAAGKELDKLNGGKLVDTILGPVESAMITGVDKTLDVMGFKQKGEDQYDAQIRAAAIKYGISPLWLKSVIKAESGFDRYARSQKGALGLTQMMPKTGAHYGLKSMSDFYDPAKSIDAGAHYLSDLARRYNGDMYKATVGYNAGSYERGVGLFRRFSETAGAQGTRESLDYANKVVAFMRPSGTDIVRNSTASGGPLTPQGVYALADPMLTETLHRLTTVLDRFATNISRQYKGATMGPIGP